jgi:NAD(P)-dependent dehydrogenase (short-subunit alcohol dehydrogenase family)
MARRMIARQQEGNIVNIASVFGFGVMKAVSPYTISKAGIVQATKAMALEFAGNRIRIRINALAPGYIDTEINHEFWSTPGGERLINEFCSGGSAPSPPNRRSRRPPRRNQRYPSRTPPAI